jgi:hypothetical protein
MTEVFVRPSRDDAFKGRAWPFEEAKKILARLGDKPAPKGYVLFETGYGPSGLPHIGTFGEVARTTWVRNAFARLTGLPSRLLAFSDDMDGLRKVPDNVPNKALLILTGNNISFAGDMPRRVLVCRIDPETDRPFSREFELKPLEHVLSNRLEMAAAACTLVRAALISDVRGAGRLASFENWDTLVRQTVIFADQVLRPGKFGDPMSLVEAAQNNDIQKELLFALLSALHASYPDQWFTARSIADDNSIVPTPVGRALMDLGGEDALKSPIGIGRLLKYRNGQIVHQLRLIAAFGSQAHKYKVEDMSGKSGG